MRFFQVFLRVSCHVFRLDYRVWAIPLVFSSVILAENNPAPRISKESRQEIVHAFDE